MKCPNCRAENNDGSQYCQKCGQKLADQDACPQCGYLSPPKSLYCNQCGQSLTNKTPVGITAPMWALAAAILSLVVAVAVIIVMSQQTHSAPKPGKVMGQSASGSPPNPHDTSQNEEPQVKTDPAQDSELQQQLKEVELHFQPGSDSLLISTGNIYYDFGYYSHATEIYEKVLASDSANIDVTVDCATCYFYDQAPEKTLKLLEKAIELDPKHINATYNMAVVLNSVGNHEQAVTWFEKALQLQPDGPMAERAKQFVEKFRQMKSGDAGAQ